MSTSPSSQTRQPPAADLTGLQLAVSPYERTASLIVALLLIVGFFVVLLFVIAFARRLVQRPAAIPVELIEDASGRGDHPIGTGLDALEPGVEDFPQLAEPSFDQLIDQLQGFMASDQALSAEGNQTPGGRGEGDRRRAGPLGDSDIIQRGERWEIGYSATSLQEYARQLDYFGIELGVVGGGVQGVDYVAGFSNGAPRTRHVDDPASEDRLYFTWRSGPLQQFDRQLVQQAGIPLTGRRVLQFYPPEVEQQLAVLELQAAKGRSARDIRKTRFGVRPAGSGYEYHVISIEFR